MQFNLHPAIKLICVLIISLSIGLKQWYGIALSLFILAPIYLYQPSYWQSAWRMIKRLKWFYLSIFLVYLLFSPDYNSAQFEHLVSKEAFESIFSGFNQGMYRIAILVFIILAVNTLICSSKKEELLAGMYWLLTPLNYLGLNTKPFLLRSFLSLSYLDKLSEQLKYAQSQHKHNLKEQMNLSYGAMFKLKVKFLAGFIQDWLNEHDRADLRKPAHNKHLLKGHNQASRAMNMPKDNELQNKQNNLLTGEYNEHESIVIRLLKRPALNQWFFPIGLIGLYSSLNWL